MELYEQIRREYEFGVGSVIGVARKLGVHRRMVREAVRNAVPAQRKKTERPALKMAPAVSLIDSILELDRKAPRKQRHTSRRIYDRIRAEIPGCTPAERTVRQYVERRKQALGVAEHEVFVPQSYDWGVEAQVDWYEACADLDGERVKLQVFSMRSMASGAAFHRAYPCATQQAFLEAHELAFAYFEGVFRRLRYDNLSSAVKKILRGQQRELTARFIAFRIRALAEGGYLERAEPVLLVGDPGTGKSHLATGLAIAACRQRKRVRFTTAAALVNQLVEAQREQSLSRMLARWSRVELIVIDELGYVPLAEVAAELLFQVIAERAEKAAIIVTTNLPFSEWPQVFTNARLCKAVLDRLTDQAHIIETGSESYRFRRTLRKKTKE